MAWKLYRHYKGGIYEVLAEARYTETQEELIVYRSLETGKTWVRPKAIFFGKTDDGRPRFTKVITRLEKVLCDKKAMRDLLIKDNCPHHFGLEDYETAGNHGCMGVKCEDCWNERAKENDKT